MGDLVLTVDWDITQAEAKARKLQREYDNAKKEIESKKIEIKGTSEDVEKAKNKLESLKTELEEIRKANITAIAQKNPEEEGKTYSLLKSKRAEIEKQTQLLAKQQALYKSQEISLGKLKNKAANIGDQILLNSKKQNKFTQAFQKSQKSADQFGKRLKSLITSALFFSVVTKAFTALRNEFGKLITETGTKTAALVSQLNGSLAVLGRTIYESAKPYIEWILQALIKMVNVLTQGLSKILGKNVNEMKKLAQQTKKAGDEAKKTTAGFDTVQTLGSSQGGSDSGVGTDFSALNDGIDSEIGLLMMALSGAALVLGVILAFTGVNIPLGLGLIAIGAVGLAASYAATWDSLSPNVKSTVTGIIAIVSGALLAIGVILAFSGVNIILGLALIAAGAAGLATMVAPNWNSMNQSTKDTITSIMAIGGALFLLIGLALLLTGVGIPLGIGLLLMGAGLLFGAVSLSPGDTFLEKIKNLWNNVKNIVKNFINWFSDNVLDGIFGEGLGDTLSDMWDNFTGLFDDIISFFKNVFTGKWEDAGRDLVNIVVGILNLIIDQINYGIQFFLGGGAKLINWIGDVFGADWNLDASHIKIPHIPKLATGAVLPGGSPMLAWVNDQPKGQPYLEGSVENIAAAFEKYLGGRDVGNKTFRVEAKGNMAQLIRLLALEITEEQNRVSVF